MAWYIFSTDSPAKNFGYKNACIIVDLVYYRRTDEIKKKIIFTSQLEHAADFEKKEHAESICDRINSMSDIPCPYLSVMEIIK